MSGQEHKYEYAGFRYIITETAMGAVATPEPGQHPAANKDKHRRAAVECWRQDKVS